MPGHLLARDIQRLPSDQLGWILVLVGLTALCFAGFALYLALRDRKKSAPPRAPRPKRESRKGSNRWGGKKR